MWPRFINILIGVWLMAAPSILNYPRADANNLYIFGPVIATIAAIAIAESVRDVRLVNFFLGIWIALSPWIIGPVDQTVVVNNIISGLAVSSFSIFKGKIRDSFAGGWTGLFTSSSVHRREAEKIKKKTENGVT
jgi:hypothetical protein